MTPTMLVINALCCCASFAFGWWIGQRDFAKDLDDELGDCLDRLGEIHTHCATCATAFVASCPKGCGVQRSTHDRGTP
jgi:hypothetical protein